MWFSLWEVVFLLNCLPVRLSSSAYDLSSYEVVFLWGHLCVRSSSCDTIFKVILAQRKRHSSSLFDTKTDSLEQCMTNDISMIMIIHVLIVEINIHLYYLYIPSLGLVTTLNPFLFLLTPCNDLYSLEIVSQHLLRIKTFIVMRENYRS